MMQIKDNMNLQAVFRILLLEKQVNDISWCCMYNSPINEYAYANCHQFRLVNNSKIHTNCYQKKINIDKLHNNSSRKIVHDFVKIKVLLINIDIQNLSTQTK